ncbi:hypothetical protein PYW07_005173 [Mythimna separata]|uniref:Gustatory receptor n=1 Tax=Mythimna separata TaxID=271217 RepID=A0AAD7YEH0_MYTSE|nr:hypothetical protein PYW07_005173 [Mythimna separata]
MTPPSVLVNTYFSGNDKPYIDPISKIFILSQLAFGSIRLPLLGDVHIGLIILAAIYSLLLSCAYGYVVYENIDAYPLNIVICIFCIQCMFFMTFNVISIRRMQRYYNELNVFDKEVGCRPRIGTASIRNLMSTIVMMLYIVIIFALPHIFVSLENLYLGMVPYPIMHILEVHFCGHLLSLLLPRLRLINYYMELSLSNSKITKNLNIEQFGYSKADSNKTLCKMEKVMNLYHNMIKSYNYLIESVKWQLLVTIVSAFLNILSCCYRVSLTIIKEDVPLTFMITYVGLLAGIMLPLFSPCMLGDQVHNEVRRLRELLASRLYENQLDKSSRGMARALLAWTETRDLSFSLLRMLDIDISLPFKFVGLLVTYLIILLQFQKVINP